MGNPRALLSGARLTPAGRVLGVGLVGLAVVAVRTGDNLIFMLLSGGCALLVVGAVLGALNLRGLRVRRRLPAELFAGRPALGALRLVNERRLLSAWSVRLEDLAGDADGTVLRVRAQGSAETTARWTFPRRGHVELGGVRLSSAWPFGLVVRARELRLPEPVLVFPAPGGTPSGGGERPGPGEGHDPSRRGREGELRDLRRYRSGDSLHDIHWVTSARVGAPVVVEREANVVHELVVVVDEAEGEAWERALERATGEVSRQARSGCAVGLQIQGRLWAPRSGLRWRRFMLGVLAQAPRRGTP